MRPSVITYQVATHYLAKIALRLEILYDRITSASTCEQAAIHHLALLHTIEISKLIEKPELKSRFLKELMRFEYTMTKQDAPLPEDLLSALQGHIQLLTHLTQRFGEPLLQDPVLQSVYIHQYHPHEVELDAPPLLYWLEQSARHRQSDLNRWLSHLKTIYATVQLYLSIIRHHAPFETVIIQNGFYQQPIHTKRTCYLILLRLLKSIELIPKIQVGHYGVTVRLCETGSLKEIQPPDIQFELAICQLL